MHTYHLLIILTSVVTTSTMTMEDYQLDLAHIKRLQRKYIGKHGWTVKTDKNGKYSVCIDCSDGQGEFYAKTQVIREFKEYQNTQFLLQLDTTNKSIISDDNDVHIIDMQTGEAQETLSGHTDLVHCCAHTDYRHILVTGSNDTTIKLWNIKNNQCMRTLHSHKHYVTNVASKGNTITSTDREPCLKLWDMSSAKTFHTKLFIDKSNEHHMPTSLMMHNNLIYVGLTKGIITIIDPRSTISVYEGTTHAGPVECLTPCTNNNDVFYSGSSDQTVKQWDLRRPNAPTKILHKKNNPDNQKYSIQNVYEDHNGKKIFSSDKNRIYIWDVSTEEPKIVTTKKFDHAIYPNCMRMNNDETELYIGTKEGIKTLTPALSFEQLAALAEQK